MLKWDAIARYVRATLRAGQVADFVLDAIDPASFAVQHLGFRPLDYQLELLTNQSKRICVRMARQSGKTTTIAVKAIWFAVSHPSTLSLIVAPSLRQSMIMMDRLQGLINHIGYPLRRKLVARMQRTTVRLRNGSQIVALPCSENLLRGYTAHLILCDEAAFFKDAETIFYNIIFPMLSTTDGMLIVSSTPWGKGGPFYRFSNDPEFSKHVVTWEGAVESGLIRREFVEEMRRQLPTERFRMEFEAQFVEDDLSWLRQDVIANCIEPQLDTEYIQERDIL